MTFRGFPFSLGRLFGLGASRQSVFEGAVNAVPFVALNLPFIVPVVRESRIDTAHKVHLRIIGVRFVERFPGLHYVPPCLHPDLFIHGIEEGGSCSQCCHYSFRSGVVEFSLFSYLISKFHLVSFLPCGCCETMPAIQRTPSALNPVKG